MRSLSPTLLAAQKEATHTPFVRLEASNRIAGVVRLDWSRLYTGTESDYYHAATMPGDGSLIRTRITPPSDARKLYRQRVTGPGPSSDFSQWTYCGVYNVVIVACCSLGAEVSIFWIGSNRAVYHMKSNDCGVNWGSPQLIDYTPTTAINGIAAAQKPNGDIALFFGDQSTLYVKKRIEGNWESKAAWDKSTGDLSGAAAAYDGDWNLIVSGRDSGGNFKLWSLVYGDGGAVPAGAWSALKEFASAPSDGNFEYPAVAMDRPDVYRCFFVEKFTGTENYSRPFLFHSIPGTAFTENLWREPVPFNLSGEYGLAVTHHGDYCWLSRPNGVWRAGLTVQSIDLTGDVLSLREELGESGGTLTVELKNDDGRYASPGEGDLSVLDTGCQLDFSPGYITSQGQECSPGPAFRLDAFEHVSAGGRASLLLYAHDARQDVDAWQARQQFRWNKTAGETSIKDILALVAARAGLKLEVKSESPVLTGYCPDFTIHPGSQGETVIGKLLSFVPDVLFIEGNKACIVNPLPSDGSVYSYGMSHPLIEGRYRRGAWEYNRAQVEGYDTAAGAPVIVDSFSWDEIARSYDRLSRTEDTNIDTVEKAQARGEACLREAEIKSGGGAIRIPVNCGQQMYDVIDITDSRAGLSAVKKRVLGLVLVYDSRRGQYHEQLLLGSV